MPRIPTPTIQRWQLGQRLRHHREQAGVTAKAAAAEIEVSAATLSKIEGGKQQIRPLYVKLLATQYGLDTATRHELLKLAEEANRPEWYVAHAKHVPDWFRQYLGYEAAATELRSYASELVGGLLQTTGYARAIALANQPESTVRDLDSYIALRSGRQERLATMDPPTTFHAVLNEAVLLRDVGGPDVMREQLAHIVELAKLPHVTVQILPFSAGAHPAMTAPFMMLGFEIQEMNTVYLENGRGAVYLEGRADLDRYTWMFQQLTKLALSPRKSREHLAKVAGDL